MLSLLRTARASLRSTSTEIRNQDSLAIAMTLHRERLQPFNLSSIAAMSRAADGTRHVINNSISVNSQKTGAELQAVARSTHSSLAVDARPRDRASRAA